MQGPIAVKWSSWVYTNKYSYWLHENFLSWPTIIQDIPFYFLTTGFSAVINTFLYFFSHKIHIAIMSPTKAINRRCGRPPRCRLLRPWRIFNFVQKHCNDIIIILSENPGSVEEIPFFLSFFLVNRELF